MSNSVRPHRWQPTRLPRPWGSPGKNTGVGCHFFLQCMKVKNESEVAQSCPTPSNPMDCGLPSCSIHGIFQARVLELGAIIFSERVCIRRLFITLFLFIFPAVSPSNPHIKFIKFLSCDYLKQKSFVLNLPLFFLVPGHVSGQLGNIQSVSV